MREGLSVLAVLILFALLHSLPAAGWVKERAAARWGGGPVRRYYRFGYTLCSLVLTAAAWSLLRRIPDAVLISLPGEAALFLRLLQACSLLLAASGFGVFSGSDFLGLSQLRGGGPSGEGRVDVEGLPFLPLQERGVYRFLRHPMYAGGIAFFLFSPAFTRTWILVRIAAAGYFLYGALVEERRLLRIYGEEYRRYMRKVPRFLPDIFRKGRRGR